MVDGEHIFALLRVSNRTFDPNSRDILPEYSHVEAWPLDGIPTSVRLGEQHNLALHNIVKAARFILSKIEVIITAHYF